MQRPDGQSQVGSTGGKWFSTTHWSVVLSAKGPDLRKSHEALESLCRTYWYPLYAYVRRSGHGPRDAQDLTREFFARLVEDDFLGRVKIAVANKAPSILWRLPPG